MNCPECGEPYVMGGRSHKECGDAKEARERRVDDIEARLAVLETSTLDVLDRVVLVLERLTGGNDGN